MRKIPHLMGKIPHQMGKIPHQMRQMPHSMRQMPHSMRQMAHLNELIQSKKLLDYSRLAAVFRVTVRVSRSPMAQLPRELLLCLP
jgi:hypothetical protein